MFDGPHREESLFGHMFTAHQELRGQPQVPTIAPANQIEPEFRLECDRVPVETSNRLATAAHPPPGKESGNRQGAKKRRRARQSERRPDPGCMGAVGAVPLPHPTRPPAPGLNLCECGEQCHDWKGNDKRYGACCFDCFIVRDLSSRGEVPLRRSDLAPSSPQGDEEPSHRRGPTKPHQATPELKTCPCRKTYYEYVGRQDDKYGKCCRDCYLKRKTLEATAKFALANQAPAPPSSPGSMQVARGGGTRIAAVTPPLSGSVATPTSDRASGKTSRARSPSPATASTAAVGTRGPMTPDEVRRRDNSEMRRYVAEMNKSRQGELAPMPKPRRLGSFAPDFKSREKGDSEGDVDTHITAKTLLASGGDQAAQQPACAAHPGLGTGDATPDCTPRVSGTLTPAMEQPPGVDGDGPSHPAEPGPSEPDGASTPPVMHPSANAAAAH